MVIDSKLSCNSNYDMEKARYIHPNPNPHSHSYPCPHADDNATYDKYLREYKGGDFLVEIY